MLQEVNKETQVPIPSEQFATFQKTEIGNMLPHSGKMRLVHSIVAYKDGCGIVEGTVAEGFWNVEAGLVKDVWFIEMMAQAVGALFGYECKIMGRPPAKAGFLITIDKYQAFETKMPVGSTFQVESERLHLFPPFGIYRTALKMDGLLFANAEMKFFVEEVAP